MRLPLKIDLDNNDRDRKIWFVSDIHYNHENVLKLNKDTRKFKDIVEMNTYIEKELVSKINLDQDIFFDLGDFIWKDDGNVGKKLRSLLPINSYKIIGNHDNPGFFSNWTNRGDIFDLMVKYKGETIKLVLSHYPMLDWNNRFHGSLNLHGHCHGHIDKINQESGELRFDLGFDGIIAQEVGSFLISFEEIWKRAKEITKGEDFHNWAKIKLKLNL